MLGATKHTEIENVTINAFIHRIVGVAKEIIAKQKNTQRPNKQQHQTPVLISSLFFFLLFLFLLEHSDEAVAVFDHFTFPLLLPVGTCFNLAFSHFLSPPSDLFLDLVFLLRP